MTIPEFIEAAIEGGWSDKTHFYNLIDSDGNPIRSAVAMLVLDPLAWKAVGKVKGWGETTSRTCICGMCVIPDEQYPRKIWEDRIAQEMMTRMVIALNDDKTLEEYIATL